MRPTLTRQNSRGKEKPKLKRSIKLGPIYQQGQSNHHHDDHLNHNGIDPSHHPDHLSENHSRGLQNGYDERIHVPEQQTPQQMPVNDHSNNAQLAHRSAVNPGYGQYPLPHGLPPSHSMPNTNGSRIVSPLPPLPQTSPPQYSSPFFNGVGLPASASTRTARSASTPHIQPLRLSSQLPLDPPPPYEEHQGISRRPSSNRQDGIDLSVSGGGGGEDPATSINIRLGGAQGGLGGAEGGASSSEVEDFNDAESRVSINLNHTGTF